MARKNNDTKEKIYKEAFKLFMSKPYELVTISDIEKAIGMTRGAVFYYVKDKEDLFKEVIERYFLTNQYLHNRIEYDKLDLNMSFSDFIDVFISGVERTISELYVFGGVNEKSDRQAYAKIDRSYLSLVMTTGYYFGDFNEKMSNLLIMERNTWSFFLQKGIEKGEIKPGTDVRLYGELFSYTFLGLALNDSLNNGIDLKHLKRLYMQLYHQIKC